MRVLAAASILLVTVTAQGGPFDCDEEASRKTAISAAGVTRARITGRAGSLKIVGRAGVTEVVATGTACADDRDDLQGIQLRSRRDGSEIEIEAVVPESSSWFGTGQSTLNFEVVLPAGLAIEVIDGSGSTDIRDVGSLEITDGSGSLQIRGVRGDAEIRDGSGSIDVSDVTGSVRVRDGSGSIDIANVTGSVLIDSDGSGGVNVSNVKGDFEVRRKGSGGVDYDRVSGRVNVPERHRD
jgi:hypothetical protein